MAQHIDIKAPPPLDWYAIQEKMGTEEYDPESIVHEIAHVLDAEGMARVKKGGIGNQRDVGRIVNQRFTSSKSLNLSELRTSAITFLTLEPFGQAKLTSILSSAQDNLNGLDRLERLGESKEDALTLRLLTYIKSSKIRRQVDALRQHLIQIGNET